MARTIAPLLSFDGRGQLAKTMVYSSWKGVPYTRRYVIPANPQTLAQQTTRKTFALLREVWKIAPANLQATWNAFAQGRPFTGMNKLVGENIRVLRGEPDMNNFIASPGSKGGPAPANMTATTGTNEGEIDATVTPPLIPTGWTLKSAEYVAFMDQDPAGIFVGPIATATVTADPWSATLTGLPAGEVCQVCAWLTWQKTAGQLAYSVSLIEQAAAAS